MANGTFSSALRAQTPSPQSLRLTVRPHMMVLGTRNEAGQHLLDSLGDSVYIPPTAVGTRRVPLVLSFSGDNITRWHSMADRYGMIFVTLRGSLHDVLYGAGIKDIDAALQKVLSTYAIDPDKIALLGMSNGGILTVNIGCQNLDIFSRIGLISPVPGVFRACVDTTRPIATRTRVFLTMGVGEPNVVLAQILAMAPQVRRDGHPLQFGLNLRFHVSRRKDYGNLWQWLSDTWASPRTTVRSARGGTAVPLTTSVLAKMTTFWTSFRHGHPPAEQDEWPGVHEKTVMIPVGAERTTVYDMTNLRAIAAKDPSVAVALKKAGLTFPQEESYRAAFIGARATMLSKNIDSTLATIPAVARNVTFFQEHMSGANALLDLMGVPRCEIGPQEQYEAGSCFDPHVQGIF